MPRYNAYQVFAIATAAGASTDAVVKVLVQSERDELESKLRCFEHNLRNGEKAEWPAPNYDEMECFKRKGTLRAAQAYKARTGLSLITARNVIEKFAAKNC